jgi:hypothetical protein
MKEPMRILSGYYPIHPSAQFAFIHGGRSGGFLLVVLAIIALAILAGISFSKSK